jgi:hypothetical protein
MLLSWSQETIRWSCWYRSSVVSIRHRANLRRWVSVLNGRSCLHSGRIWALSFVLLCSFLGNKAFSRESAIWFSRYNWIKRTQLQSWSIHLGHERMSRFHSHLFYAFCSSDSFLIFVFSSLVAIGRWMVGWKSLWIWSGRILSENIRSGMYYLE